MAAIVSPDSPPVQRQGARAGGDAAARRSSSLMANAIRALSMDAVQQANSGHPGAPMGMAEIAVALWGRHLRHNPGNPRWPGRDRSVLSNGHGSMLLYSLLHLTGYDLALSELRNFRQLHSKTPGHPEFAITPASRRRPGRSARAWRMPSAWRSPKSCSLPSSTATATASSTTAPTSSSATAA